MHPGITAAIVDQRIAQRRQDASTARLVRAARGRLLPRTVAPAVFRITTVGRGDRHPVDRAS